jgi:hypothetical protein
MGHFAYDVFLSHSSKDKSIVREIAERLRQDGLKVWFDEWEIKPGDSIPARIEEGLEHSRIMVLCMSVNAFGSDWAQLESGIFRFRDPLNKERRFIPLRLDDTPIKGTLAQFSYLTWRPKGSEGQYAKLLTACNHSPTSASAPKLQTTNSESKEHVAALVSARKKEWHRVRRDFETAAATYHDVSLSVYFVTNEKLSSRDKFPEPNYAINLWQYYGDSCESRDRLCAEKFTEFGITGAEVSAFGLISGKQTDLFRSMANRAGGLLPDEVSRVVTDAIAEKIQGNSDKGNPILVSNSNSLAKWINMVLIATSTCHPERFRDRKLSADPFAASLTVFDYFHLDE